MEQAVPKCSECKILWNICTRICITGLWFFLNSIFLSFSFFFFCCCTVFVYQDEIIVFVYSYIVLRMELIISCQLKKTVPYIRKKLTIKVKDKEHFIPSYRITHCVIKRYTQPPSALC